MQLADLKFKDGSKFTSLLDLVFPIGSTYMSMGSASPDTLFGGTWSKVTGGVLALAGTSGYAAAGAAGGSKKISVDQMPSHEHWVYGRPNTGNLNGVGIYPVLEGYGSFGPNNQFEQNMPLAQATGGGADYYPLHLSVNVWQRTS